MDDINFLGKRPHDPASESSGSGHLESAGGGGAGDGGPAKRPSGDDAEVKALENEVREWRALVLKLTGEGKAVGACEAEVKQYDAEAKLARLQGRPEAEAEAKAKAAKAEMAKAEAKMAKAEAKMAAAVEGTLVHTMAKAEYERADSEYKTAKKVHDALLEQVTGGGNGAHPTIVGSFRRPSL